LLSCAKRGSELPFVEVKREDLVVGVEVVGALAAVDSTDIKPPALSEVWNFKIAMLAPEGAEVKVGEPIAGFDSSEQTRELETLQNEIDAAQKKLEQKRNSAALARREEDLAIALAEANVRKATLKTTTPGELVATIERKTMELDEKAVAIALEQAKIKAARARRADESELASLTEKRAYAAHRATLLEANLSMFMVKAARAGTLIYPMGWRGEKKKVGDQVYRLEVLLQVVGLGKMIGEGEVDEVDISKVAPRQVVSLRLDALPDVQLRGTVESIAKTVHGKSQADPSKVVEIKIVLDATTAPLRPGMRFRGEVETERVAKVVQVPIDAVFVTADGPVAYRQTGGGIEKVKVELGRRSASVVEVKAGLAPGDRVSRVDPERRTK
nr:HlyD family efflux transporter periplasmic adaptor subunit [Deltaproteobacteria bacterium]